MTKKEKTAVSTLIKDLRHRYRTPFVPKCKICGMECTSIAAAGMGRITYCCPNEDAQPMGKGDKFDECMAHFAASRFETNMIDGDILELCDAAERMMG